MNSPLLFRLVYRNIAVNIDPGTMVLLIALPAIYLVFFGFGLQSAVTSFTQGVGYLSFLTPGIMAFQSVIAGSVGGTILWIDRRYGMLAQLLAQPFTRLQYLLGIMISSVIFGLAGALVMLLGAWLLIGSLSMTILGAIALFVALAVGSLLFGSMMLLLSALVKSYNAANSIQTLILIVVNFASTVFFPYSNDLPWVIRALLLANPLTYVVNVARDGYLGVLTSIDVYQLLILSAETIALLMLAVKAYMRPNISFQ